MLFRKHKFYLNNFIVSKASKIKNKTENLNLLFTESLLNENISVYNGKEYILLEVKEDMKGLKLKDFIFTRKKAIFVKKK